ncbi:MAG: NAD-dependent epimerase/dehydratase family protein [Nanoarchaeota archaeon]|nr:NAD-dependent epimerase/dehydratase family protein [Nanoarchaeota archaeon]
MVKIVITGGLGYIGMQLCELYKDSTHEVIVLDKRFIPECVRELTKWGIDYIEGDIMNKDLLKNSLRGADIVYHLAGVTDVAHLTSEENKERELEIKGIGEEGSINIINSISDNCKIIFPSSHVIFEGLKKTTLNITEETSPSPILTYSSGKLQTEKDLVASGKKYIICRLSTNYGYGLSMRLNIMPNLFSKMASQGKNLKLFSGGANYKPLCCVKDTARCLKFLAESKIYNEIFNIVSQNKTVKEVAEICREASNIQLNLTDDEIPNLGYTLSNKKLLDTGFKFKYKIEEELKSIINKWKNKTELEYIIKSDKGFEDDRGIIKNYELPGHINWIGWITSKAGTMRANHYHPIQEQKVLLISGKFISVFKDLKEKNSIVQTHLVQAGDVVVTTPNVAHTMVFLEDSLFLNLVNGEREHENFGKHTIPYQLVSEEERENLFNNYKISCRICDNTNLKKVISLGNSPLANNLLDSKTKAETFPLEMNYCDKCHYCQLSYTVPPEKLFDNYLYVSSTTKSFRDHFRKLSEQIVEKYNPGFVIDVGSNDGIFLKPLKEKNVEILGIEPAKNISELANENGIRTLNSYFDESVVNKTDKKADIITAFNVFAHTDKIKTITDTVKKLLKEDGTFIIEVQYLLDTLRDLTFDNIYHEHVSYWSVTSLNNFFERQNMKIINVEHIDTHGGSIRVYIKRSGEAEESVIKFMKEEEEFGLKNYHTYKLFARRVEALKKKASEDISSLKGSIVGYGAPAKATTVLNYFGIDDSKIDYIIEDNKLKHGKFIPIVNIPIRPKNFSEDIPDNILILAWNFAEEIKKNNQELVDKGVNFITLR